MVTAAFHAWAAGEHAARLQRTEAGRRALADYRRLIADPEQQDFTDAIGQPRGGWDDAQTAAFGQVQELFADDLIRITRIPVGAAPSSPPDRDADQAALEALRPVFTAVAVHQDTDEGGGLLSWRSGVSGRLPGGWATGAPLETGRTDASRTYLHLADRGAVARWPLGSDHLWLLGFTTFTAWAQWRDDSFRYLLDDGAGGPGQNSPTT